MNHVLNADAWEQLTLDVLAEPLMWQPKAGVQIAPGSGERESWDELLIPSNRPSRASTSTGRRGARRPRTAGQRPAAIELVMEQMEFMAPRYAA